MEPMAQVLRQLPAMNHPNLLAGSANSEDAGVYRLGDGLAIVMTTDFFPPLVDDPYTFGQIAATNSLSDVYAMGGTPVAALNLVGFPDDKLDMSILGDILRGGADKVLEAGAVIVGGHSVRDGEIKYGLAVTGTVDPAKMVRNSGAKPGDKLILTKPIGSGVLTSAAKLGKIKPDEISQAVAVMCLLNRAGRDAMISVGVHAATDITGFGLLGHAFEMAQASDVALVLEADAVPLLDKTRELAGRRCLTRSYKSTLARLGKQLASDGVDELVVKVLADAQTSGGLLISLPADRCDAFVAAYGQQPDGVYGPTVIGQVLPPCEVRVRLRA